MRSPRRAASDTRTEGNRSSPEPARPGLARSWEGAAGVSARSFPLPSRVPRKRLAACLSARLGEPGWVAGDASQRSGGCGLVPSASVTLGSPLSLGAGLGASLIWRDLQVKSPSPLEFGSRASPFLPPTQLEYVRLASPTSFAFLTLTRPSPSFLLPFHCFLLFSSGLLPS